MDEFSSPTCFLDGKKKTAVELGILTSYILCQREIHEEATGALCPPKLRSRMSQVSPYMIVIVGVIMQMNGLTATDGCLRIVAVAVAGRVVFRPPDFLSNFVDEPPRFPSINSLQVLRPPLK